MDTHNAVLILPLRLPNQIQVSKKVILASVFGRNFSRYVTVAVNHAVVITPDEAQLLFHSKYAGDVPEMLDNVE